MIPYPIYHFTLFFLSFNFVKILIQTIIYTRPNLCKSSENTRKATQAINKGTENKTVKMKNIPWTEINSAKQTKYLYRNRSLTSL